MQGEADRLAPTLLSWVSLHTFAEYWLSPYAYSFEVGVCNDPSDIDRYRKYDNNPV